MNKLIYDRNMEMLKKKYPAWAELLLKKKDSSKIDVIVEKSYTDEPILKIESEEQILYLNGKYAPDEAVSDWLKEIEKIDKFATIIIVGISNGIHIKKIMESVPDTVNILVYEPSFKIFKRAMEEVDLSFLFELNIPVGIIIDDINDFEIESYFSLMITYDNMISLKIYISGNYRKLFYEKVENFIGKLKSHMREIEVTWNTTVRYTDVNARNVFHNLQYLYDGYSVADLKGILPKNVPAIIVSAGPSLNKNLMELRKVKGKACIIATDTAMKPLLNAGIIPDLFMIVDGLKPKELFEHKDISKVGMVTMTAVSCDPMDIHKGKKYFYDSGSPYETDLVRIIDGMDTRNVCIPTLPTGGSVATSAFSLGIYMGAQTVILVGQDLALTGNKVHVDGAFENEKCEINMQSGEYIEVDSVDGGKVVTRIDFKLYLDWFEKIIEEWKNIHVVDATEGGALIRGTEIMTLNDAIKKYCVKEYNVKWHLTHVPKIFNTTEERRYALQYFGRSIEELDLVMGNARCGIKYYNELQKLTNSNIINSKQFRKIYKNIKKINSYMENDAMAETVIDSLKGIEYALRTTIYRTNTDEKSEIKDIVQQGKLMLTSILIAAEEIKEIAKQTIVPFVKNINE